MQSLSVLIAAYNCNCLPLVEQLLPMLQNNLEAYEVIVSDDATADPEITKANEAINQLPGCRYILKPKNAGATIWELSANILCYCFLTVTSLSPTSSL